MKCDIRYKPAFAAIFVTLNPGDSITAEAGAMTSMDAQLTIKTEFSGGLISGLLKKFFGGESLFPTFRRSLIESEGFWAKTPSVSASNQTIKSAQLIITESWSS